MRFLLVGGLFVLLLGCPRSDAPLPDNTRSEVQALIRTKLSEVINQKELPEEIDYLGSRWKVAYTLDPKLQKAMDKLLRDYRPDYGAFVTLDAETGDVLTLSSYSREENSSHLALKGSYPAASIFKIVTAAAALDSRKLRPDSVIPFRGGNHTLYKRNVNSIYDEKKWSRFISLKQAFAKSINTVFGIVGIQHVGKAGLGEYARRFLFNTQIPGDIPVENGSFGVDGEEIFTVAEAASGFNRTIRMSPLQGALLSAAAANQGIIMEPHLVRGIMEGDKVMYATLPKVASEAVTPDTALELRELMRETIEAGTAVRPFRELKKKVRDQITEIGGKTGSLKGDDPKGNTDWFVGYVIANDRKIAISALTVNVEKWRIKSSQMASHFVEQWLRP